MEATLSRFPINNDDKAVSLTVSTPKRRVLFINHSACLGGAELSLLDLACAYRESGQVILLEDGPLRDRLQESGVKTRILATPDLTRLGRNSSVLKAIKACFAARSLASYVAGIFRDFEMIHANTQKAFIVGSFSSQISKIPVVWHLRDILTTPSYNSYYTRFITDLANRWAARVFVNSCATGSEFVAAGGRPELIRLIYNGIDQNAFEGVSAAHIAELRANLGIGKAPLVGIFSRLSYWKGQHVLLEALRELPHVHALLVGEALFGEDDYVVKLRQLSSNSELTGRVHWLGFRSDVPALMAACDIIVHTSIQPEPFGRVIVESYLANRPIIAAAAGGPLEIIRDGITGRLIPPNNAAILASTIRELLDNPSVAQNLARQGRLHARTTFSLDALLTNFENALQDISSR